MATSVENDSQMKRTELLKAIESMNDAEEHVTLMSLLGRLGETDSDALNRELIRLARNNLIELTAMRRSNGEAVRTIQISDCGRQGLAALSGKHIDISKPCK